MQNNLSYIVGSGGGGGRGREDAAIPRGGWQAPLNAPTGPAAMRGEVRQATRERTSARSGQRRDSPTGRGLGVSRSASANPPGLAAIASGVLPRNTALKKKQVVLSAPRCRPPYPYVDQAVLGSRGSRGQYQNCLRCGQPRGAANHRDFVNCKKLCDCCGSATEHIGEACPRIYASTKWWTEHHGYVPENVQIRPTEAQRERLAKEDSWFETNPAPVKELMSAVQSAKKRPAKDDDAAMELEVELRASRAKEQYYKELLSQHKEKVRAAERTQQGELANAQHELTLARNLIASTGRVEEQLKLRDENKRLALALEQQQVQHAHQIERLEAERDALAQRVAEIPQELDSLREERDAHWRGKIDKIAKAVKSIYEDERPNQGGAAAQVADLVGPIVKVEQPEEEDQCTSKQGDHSCMDGRYD
ncbi:hypothetical protein NX059_002926 [Plenodomus lindquistii]|nr:hypothetical protein NX059_002926 [Plenodomus lindquistii]